MATRTRRAGEFCWINMLTPQPDKAREFFSELLGWTYTPVPGMSGHIIKVGGSDIGGLWNLADPNTPKGLPPAIGVMVKVDSADATSDKVTSLGGSARPPFDIAENGRMASCTDPNGAEFDLWEPKKQPGTDVDNTEHGAPSWFETMTTDVDGASKFYSDLFGWSSEEMSMPEMKYTSFKQGSEYVAGMIGISAQMGDMKPHWATYFTTNDTDETSREAVDLGATVFMPPQDVPGVGRFCGITSPQGVAFYVIKYAEQAP